jgi:hypothetical protein
LESGQDFLVAFPEFAEKLFLAWNNDGGAWNKATLTFPIPSNGDYTLLVAGAYVSSGQEQSHATFGRYRLVLGLNAPDILTGEATPTEGQIAVQTLNFHHRVQEITGNLTPEKNTITFKLQPFDPGETLDVFVEATSGDLRPSLTLRNFSGQMLAFENVTGEQRVARLHFFPLSSTRSKGQ